MTDMNEWNQKVIKEFRENGGKVEQFGEMPLVILHTIGAKSGQLREIPLVPQVDGEDLTVFGSAGGSPKHPDWVFNLRGTPRITVEYGTESFEADVVELPADEAATRLTRMGETFGNFAEYVESAAPRRIPAFAINRV
ncbi:MAG: nitroreductase family deazaflavin-dependent oxidoreductase [Actinomycetota bacterium]